MHLRNAPTDVGGYQWKPMRDGMGVGKYKVRFLTLWIVSPILVGTLVVSVGVFMREPTFEGRTTRSWLTQVVHAGHDHMPAVQFFKRNGRATVPDLLPIIDGRGLRFPRWLRGHQSLFSYLPSSTQKWLAQKIEAESRLRYWAIEMCAAIGPQARSAEPALFRACADADPEVRCAAAKALVKTEAEPVVAVATLTRMLSDKVAGVRGCAAEALGLCGIAAKAAIPALRKATADPEDTVVLQAQFALIMIEHPEKVRKMPYGDDNYRVLP